jgi:hypothetical protein
LPRALVGLSPRLLVFGALGTVRCGLARPGAAGTWQPTRTRRSSVGRALTLWRKHRRHICSEIPSREVTHRQTALTALSETPSDGNASLRCGETSARAITRLAENLSTFERRERNLCGGPACSARDVELRARRPGGRLGFDARRRTRPHLRRVGPILAETCISRSRAGLGRRREARLAPAAPFRGRPGSPAGSSDAPASIGATIAPSAISAPRRPAAASPSAAESASTTVSPGTPVRTRELARLSTRRAALGRRIEPLGIVKCAFGVGEDERVPAVAALDLLVAHRGLRCGRSECPFCHDAPPRQGQSTVRGRAGPCPQRRRVRRLTRPSVLV